MLLTACCSHMASEAGSPFGPGTNTTATTQNLCERTDVQFEIDSRNWFEIV